MKQKQTNKFELEKILVLTLAFLLLVLPLTSAYSLTYDTTKNTIDINYDENNRIANQTTTSDFVSYIYDQNLNDTLTSVDNGDVAISYEYDDKKRITKEIKTIDGFVFEKEIVYDSMDRVSSLSGSFTNIEIGYAGNSLISSILGFLRIDYNSQNQIANKTYDNGLQTDFGYDSESLRLSNITTGREQDLSYSYDSVGNIVGINDSINARNLAMQYDGVNRLIFTQIDATENNIFNFAYNSIGNLIEVNSSTENTTYLYNNLAHAPNKIICLGEDTDPLEDVNKFYHKNLAGETVAWLGDSGNIVLAGQCYSGGSCDNYGDGSLVFRNSSQSILGFVNVTGDLCITTGDCSDESVSCNDFVDGAFVIVNSGNNVSYIDGEGDLCLIGGLYENAEL